MVASPGSPARRRQLVMALVASLPWRRLNAAGVAERRSALVLGNAAYRFGALPNAGRDARLMAAALASLGFEVTSRVDCGRDGLIESMKTFASSARGSAVRLVFYSGHAVQYRGANYLVGIDGHLQAEEQIPAKCASFSELVGELDTTQAGINILVLDACRINPFVEGVFVDLDGRPRRATRAGGVVAGLAEMSAPSGSLVAYAAAPNAPAFDGPPGKGSHFTRHLLARMREPGLPIELLFKRVREAVKSETKGRQVPWESSSLTGDFCFVRGPQGACRA